jgi:hypothetical protein
VTFVAKHQVNIPTYTPISHYAHPCSPPPLPFAPHSLFIIFLYVEGNERYINTRGKFYWKLFFPILDTVFPFSFSYFLFILGRNFGVLCVFFLASNGECRNGGNKWGVSFSRK